MKRHRDLISFKRSGWLLLFLGLWLAQGCTTIAPTVPQPGAVVLPPAGDARPPGGAIVVHRGEASWYGPGFVGKKTASGDIYDDTKFTAAHKTLPFGSNARVTNIRTGQAVVVKINDRGPYREGRVIDLSRAAATALGIIDSGIALVRIELLSEAADNPVTLKNVSTGDP